MGFILDGITDWIKEVLVSGIISNLSGLFNYVNEKVADISWQVGLTSQAWNGNIYAMIQNLAETVIIPIAGLILAFVMKLDLIQMLVDRNNLHDVDTWMFLNGFSKQRVLF